MPVIYTIGHSNHAYPNLLRLLRMHKIAEVVDVRSRPVSRRCPWFDKRTLQASLEADGIAYAWLGQRLGGMPREPEFYDESGKLVHLRLARSEPFRHGLEQLLVRAQAHRLAVLCAEENPAGCHRFALIGAGLAGRGTGVLHIRKSGRLQTQKDVAREAGGNPDQLDLGL